MTGPQDTADRLNAIVTAWNDHAATHTFGGMTLAQFKEAIKPSFDARDVIADLEKQIGAAQNTRNDADATSSAKAKLVINGVVGDPAFGPDSSLYEAMGYVRESERKTGLTRKPKAAKE
jgi:hypothetical protein